ncbi:hypothetical protein Pmani_016192 [Petrolisthes manimaculis]|uniref:Uncharacterized protein n=1 Tax=Petrolisthes manimaculis TaxID=1843537 RepID=A0AAE1U917_9EUCA|nr:hypothetical protein Pmani_016192 [Petrolisthes manimaculis]
MPASHVTGDKGSYAVGYGRAAEAIMQLPGSTRARETPGWTAMNLEAIHALSHRADSLLSQYGLLPGTVSSSLHFMDTIST